MMLIKYYILDTANKLEVLHWKHTGRKQCTDHHSKLQYKQKSHGLQRPWWKHELYYFVAGWTSSICPSKEIWEGAIFLGSEFSFLLSKHEKPTWNQIFVVWAAMKTSDKPHRWKYTHTHIQQGESSMRQSGMIMWIPLMMYVCVCVWNQTPVLAHSNKISLFGPNRLSLSQGGPSGQHPGCGASHRLHWVGTHLGSCVVSTIISPCQSQSAHGTTGLCVFCRWDSGSTNSSKSLLVNSAQQQDVWVIVTGKLFDARNYNW